MPNYLRELEVGLNAVRVAAGICQKVQRTIEDSIRKKDSTPVTVADYASQATICQDLNRAFPGIPIMGEEDSSELRQESHLSVLEEVVSLYSEARQETASADDVLGAIDLARADSPSARYWTLDPIDGTKGFLRKDQYAISLAYLEEGKLVVALLACPNLPTGDDRGSCGVILSAIRGMGTRIHNLEGEELGEARVSEYSPPDALRWCESFESSHSAHDVSEQIMNRVGPKGPSLRIDSQAKYALVAMGRADVYLRWPTRPGYKEKIWDHAGGILVVEEAGGVVTDIQGNVIDLSLGRELSNNRGILVTNRQCQPQVLAVCRAHDAS